MANPATKKRGGNPDVTHKPEGQKPKDAMERKLEQGLEEIHDGFRPRQCHSTAKDQASRKERRLRRCCCRWALTARQFTDAAFASHH